MPASAAARDELDRRQDAVGAERVRVEVDGRRAGAAVAAARVRRAARPCRPTLRPRRAGDPLDRERPAGRRVDVDLGRVEDDRPLADLEPRRQGVDEPRQDGLRVEADHAPDRAGHPEVRLVGRPARQDPLVAGDDVGVRADDRADPAVEMEPEGVLLGRQLAVEVDEPDRRQRLGRLVEQRVGVGERVLDRLHVRPALEVDDRELGAVERLEDAPAAAGHAVGAVVQRPQDAIVRLEVRVDLALVPDVVAGRDHVDAGREERLGGRRRQAHAAGDVLAVGRDEVDAALARGAPAGAARRRRGRACRSGRRSSGRGRRPPGAARCRWAGSRAASADRAARSAGLVHRRRYRTHTRSRATTAAGDESHNALTPPRERDRWVRRSCGARWRRGRCSSGMVATRLIAACREPSLAGARYRPSAAVPVPIPDRR